MNFFCIYISRGEFIGMKKYLYHRKPVDELTFTDDGMFQAVMRDPGLCAELVERLLHIKVNHIEYPELEKTIAPFFLSKGVRLDVYIKDSDKVIDVEMQSREPVALPQRTRYYQSMIDADSFAKGQDYSELKASYIVFICKSDPFRDANGKRPGLPRYTLTTKCQEIAELNFDDKIMKVIYNTSGYEKERDSRVRDFLHFVYTNDPKEDDFSVRLTQRVEMLKQNEQFREVYAAMDLREMDIRREALAEGRIQGAIEAAVVAVRDFNIAPQLAAQKMNAPLDKVMEKLGMPYKADGVSGGGVLH